VYTCLSKHYSSVCAVGFAGLNNVFVSVDPKQTATHVEVDCEMSGLLQLAADEHLKTVATWKKFATR